MSDAAAIEGIWADHPELGRIAAVAADPVYLVGGAVRDRLLGHDRSDIDVVVVGDASRLAAALGATPAAAHERFGTAKVEVDGHEVDIARARTETYAHPGALPDVAPAASIEADLGRRDFTINAIALALSGERALVDPHGGRQDLERGLLRVLHPASFLDDPTRAIRAARYAARFGFEPEPETERLLRAAELETVSADRRRAELRRLAKEASAVAGLRWLVESGLVEPRPGGIELASRVDRLLEREPWRGEVDRAAALLAAALGPVGPEARLAETSPARPSEGVDAARGHEPAELLLARALGAEWLDSYLLEWQQVRLEINGDDLIAAGVPSGPAIGRGLGAALRAKLDGEVDGRGEELALAVAAARPD